MRLKAIISYDGTDFYGWQIQAHHPTIQSTVEACLKEICRTPVRVTGAGRTDSGVHAYAQVAHFDWEDPLTPDRLLLGMNAILPESIRVRSLEVADPDFHARHDSDSKVYLYRIERGRVFNPFTYKYSLHYYSPLDLEKFQECAQIIVGEHDFAAYKASGTDIVKTVRKMKKVEVVPEVRETPYAPPLMHVRFQADGFLRKMVRFLVGTMLEIGSGKRPIEDIQRSFETCERRYVGNPAPARGLFLEHVVYK